MLKRYFTSILVQHYKSALYWILYTFLNHCDTLLGFLCVLLLKTQHIFWEYTLKNELRFLYIHKDALKNGHEILMLVYTINYNTIVWIFYFYVNAIVSEFLIKQNITDNLIWSNGYKVLYELYNYTISVIYFEVLTHDIKTVKTPFVHLTAIVNLHLKPALD